jgi:hypothetical protein
VLKPCRLSNWIANLSALSPAVLDPVKLDCRVEHAPEIRKLLNVCCQVNGSQSELRVHHSQDTCVV